MLVKPFKAVYANLIDAYIPELWANESVAILLENMVATRLCHIDFSNEIANFGDLVHTRKPGEFTARRKENADNVTIQDAVATDILVPLNQHVHTSFMIKDGEESKSFKQLRDEYLQPAIWSIAQFLDKVALGQAYQFLGNSEGHLGGLTSTTAKDYIIDTRKRMNINKAFPARNMILTPNSEAEALKLDLFISADKIGDEGTAMREASLGRKLQFDMYMAQNTPSITSSPVASAAALVDLATGYSAGATTVHIDGAGSSAAIGQFVTIAGDDTVQQITGLGTLAVQDIDITITPGLKRPVADGAAVTLYSSAAQINEAAGYPVGHGKEITVDNITGAIEVGSLVAFVTNATPDVADTNRYAVVATTETGGNTTGITLDRPLVNAVANDDYVAFGPNGEYNFAHHRNAYTMVMRPLAPAPAGLVLGSTVAYNNIPIRVTMTYNGEKQGTLVTVDLLCGVATLDTNLGAIMLG